MSATAGATTGRLLKMFAAATQPMTQGEIRAATGLGAKQVQCALSRLLEDGRIEGTGVHGSRGYYLAPTQPPHASGVVTGRLLPGTFGGIVMHALAPDWPPPTRAEFSPSCWQRFAEPQGRIAP